jgi:hypothetical protein
MRVYTKSKASKATHQLEMLHVYMPASLTVAVSSRHVNSLESGPRGAQAPMHCPVKPAEGEEKEGNIFIKTHFLTRELALCSGVRAAQVRTPVTVVAPAAAAAGADVSALCCIQCVTATAGPKHK